MSAPPLQQRIRLLHLRLLTGVADTGSLLAAAQRLHISQPAASKALQQLESSLGEALVLRSNSGSRLTTIGELLCRRARLILSELGDVDDEIARYQNGRIGQVQVGVMPVASAGLLPKALKSLMQEQPDIELHVVEASSDVLFPRLKEGSLDILVGRFWPSDDSDLINVVLYESRFALAVRPGHPLLSQSDLALSQLRDWPWILPPRGAHSRLALEDMFRHASLEMPHHPLQTTSYAVMRALLTETDALCPMPVETLQQDLALGLIAQLPFQLDLRLPPVGLVRLRNRSSSKACEVFMQHLRTAAQGMVPGAMA